MVTWFCECNPDDRCGLYAVFPAELTSKIPAGTRVVVNNCPNLDCLNGIEIIPDCPEHNFKVYDLPFRTMIVYITDKATSQNPST